jgi:hypothetical protein
MQIIPYAGLTIQAKPAQEISDKYLLVGYDSVNKRTQKKRRQDVPPSEVRHIFPASTGLCSERSEDPDSSLRTE